MALITLLLIIPAKPLQAQVVLRDTSISWRHFDYSLNEYYGIQQYDRNKVVDRTFNGVTLENELVKLCLIPEFGGRIISFIYKPTGHEQLYQNPIGVPYQIETGIFYHNWLMVYGGIFPTFPEPEHGKYWNTPWNYEVITNTPEKIEVSMWRTDDLNNPGHPGQYNNGETGITCHFNVILEKGKPYFDVDVTLENDATSNNYEYWTCITFAPGSEVGKTLTPSNSEMIVPIDRYQVGWNNGDWMNRLDPIVQGTFDIVREYDQLAHLSNWQDMGIAYAYPTLQENHYGVVNHDNEEGLFRISSDQSTTPGMKFWTWGDQQGLSADPTDFYNAARPYIELWSGVSQEFFEDAFLGANQSTSWTETYLPTVGIPGTDFINKEVSFYAEMDDNTLKAYAFQPIAADAYGIDLIIKEKGIAETVYTENVSVIPALDESTVYELNLESLGRVGEYEVNVSLIRNNEIAFTKTMNSAVLLGTQPSFDPKLSIVNGEIQIQFNGSASRAIWVYDLHGRMISTVESIEQQVAIPLVQSGILILVVQENGTTWSKKILVR